MNVKRTPTSPGLRSTLAQDFRTPEEEQLSGQAGSQGVEEVFEKTSQSSPLMAGLRGAAIGGLLGGLPAIGAVSNFVGGSKSITAGPEYPSMGEDVGGVMLGFMGGLLNFGCSISAGSASSLDQVLGSLLPSAVFGAIGWGIAAYRDSAESSKVPG